METNGDTAGRTKRSAAALLTVALAAPAILGVLFLPIFRRVQRHNFPTGNLQDVDLTPFARRDQLMMQAFAVALIVVVVTVGILAPSWRSRMLILVAGAVAAFAAYVAVFASLLAG